MQASASYIDRASSLISFFTFKELINQIGTTTPGVPRLGVPKYSPNESDCANFATARNEYKWATSFPMPMASMNRTLIDQIGTLISRQARAFNNAGRYGLDSYIPNINAFYSLVRGRGQETPSEDLLAVSQYAYGYITGTSGGFEPEYIKIVATAKHFGGYELENYDNRSRLDRTLTAHPGYAYTDLAPFINYTLTVMNTSCVASDYSAIFFANTTMQVSHPTPISESLVSTV